MELRVGGDNKAHIGGWDPALASNCGSQVGKPNMGLTESPRGVSLQGSLHRDWCPWKIYFPKGDWIVSDPLKTPFLIGRHNLCQCFSNSGSGTTWLVVT